MWRVLADHAEGIRDTHLAELFDADPARFERLHCECGPLLFDYSKQRLTEQTLARLFDLHLLKTLRMVRIVQSAS